MKSEFKNLWEDVYDPVEQAALLERLKEEVRYENAARSILKALSGHSDGLTKDELIQIVRCRKQRFAETLKKLLELQKVYKSKIRKKNMPYKYRLQPWN